MSKEQPTIENSIFECFLIERKIKEWRRILEKAKDNPGIKRTQLKNIQRSVGRMCDISLLVHKSAKYSDELISRMYYSILDDIREIIRYYENWNGSREDCIKDDRIKKLIEPLFTDESLSLEERLEYIVNNKDRPHEIAIEFVAETTRQMAEHDESLEELTEDRIRKKVKKIYQ